MHEKVGTYRLLEPLGGGGMAEVFLASREDRDGQLVALKCLRPSLAQDPEFRLAFHDEAKVLSHLTDERIVRFHEFGDVDGTLFVAMEYAPGQALDRVIESLRASKQRAPMDAVAAVAEDLLGALHAAHEARDEAGQPLQLVHRDVSPHNVILCRSGICKLTDFGLARFRRQVHHSEVGVLRGKVPYLAPELLGLSPVDRRADIWAAALTLYELATLTHPLAGGNDLETLERILKGDIPPLSAFRSDVPEAFDRVLQLALSRPVESRFETAAVFREALGCALPVRHHGRALQKLLRLAKRAPPLPSVFGARLLGTARRVRGQGRWKQLAWVGGALVAGVMAGSLLRPPWGSPSADARPASAVEPKR